jgi:prophage tail gpP-like protein
VKEGDTLEDLAARFYGSASLYPKILNANHFISGIDPQIFPGQILNIPESEILNEEIKVNDDGTNEVKILIEDKEISDFSDFLLKLSIDQAADEFSFIIPWDPDDLSLRELFLPFSYRKAKIFIGNVLFFTGNVIMALPDTSTDDSILKVSGYSSCGILNDCNVPVNSYPLTYENTSIFEICKKLAGLFNIKVVDDASDATPFEDVDIKVTDKVYDFIAKLAKKRGLLLSSNTKGDLVIQRATRKKASFTLSEGNPTILSISINLDGQQGFTSMTGVLNAKDAEEFEGDDVYTEIDPFLIAESSSRPNVFEIDDIEAGTLKQAVKARLRRSWANRISYNLTLEGWRNPQGEIWRDNTRLNVLYPSVMIYNTTEFLIKSISLRQDDEKEFTEMQIVLPQAYNNEELRQLPWTDEINIPDLSDVSQVVPLGAFPQELPL